MGNMIKSYIERMKNSFVPQVDDKARIAMDGTVCVRTNTANGKEWLGVKDGAMVAYPEEMLMENVPVYTIAKTIDQVKPGDIVKATSSTYARIERIEKGNVYSVSFGGNVRKNQPIKDFLTGQATVRIVVNPFNFSGADMNNNMMMLMMLGDKEEGQGDLAEIMMLASMLGGQSQTNPFGNIMTNPMTMMMFMSKDGGSMKDFMILQMLQNCGISTQTVTTAAPAPKVEVAPKAEPIAPEAVTIVAPGEIEE